MKPLIREVLQQVLEAEIEEAVGRPKGSVLQAGLDTAQATMAGR